MSDSSFASDRIFSMAEIKDRSTAFERTMADIAVRFAATPFDQIDEAIVESQRALAEVLDLDGSSLWQHVAESKEFVLTHQWARAGVPELPPEAQGPVSARLPYMASEAIARRTLSFTSLEEVPDPVDRETLASLGTKSNLSIPMVADEALLGILTFATVRSEYTWSAETVERLRLMATVFAHSLARGQARRALEQALSEVQRLKDQLAFENVQLRREVRTLKPPRLIAAESPVARQVLAQVEQVAPTPATVLMLGETGSGKEVFAQVIHDLSPRHKKPMVRVNCAAIPTALIESELFGRERGAFTGALSRQIGRFEAANGSTIFLDEIGELPPEIQVKLLRVLQERTIERLGGNQSLKVDVRVIAATNRNLEQAVANSSFREDLFYRLNVFPITVPPLRDRVEDIPSLVWSFIDEFSSAFGKSVDSITKESLAALQRYGWPGNVRELRNAIEREMIVATGPTLSVSAPRPAASRRRAASARLVDVEVEHIRSVLDSCRWRVRGTGGAAERLGVKPTTLESRMARLGIARDRPPAA